MRPLLPLLFALALVPLHALAADKATGERNLAPPLLAAHWTLAPAAQGSFSAPDGPDSGSAPALRIRSADTSGARIVATLPAEQVARLAGQRVRLSARVSGRVEALSPVGLGPVLELILGDGSQSTTARVGLGRSNVPYPGRAPVFAPVSGAIESGRFDRVFQLPANLTQVQIALGLDRASGSLDWSELELRLADSGDRVNYALPARIESPEARDAREAATFRARYTTSLEQVAARVGGLPDPASLYSPRPDLGQLRPRIYLAELPVSTLRERARSSRYSALLAALSAARDLVPPAEVPLDREDPLRDHTRRFLPLALGALLATDEAERAAYLAAWWRWAEAHESWGISPLNLPLSMGLMDLATSYDWLHADFTPAERAKVRGWILARLAAARDPANWHVTFWRGQEHLANHNWYHHSATLVAALALWGDENEDPRVQPAALRAVIDDAMLNFWIADRAHPEDGAAIEGYLYNDFGGASLYAYALNADALLRPAHSVITSAWARNSWIRLHSALPEGAGYLVYNDSYPAQFGGAVYHRLLAARLRSPEHQLAAEILENPARLRSAASRGDEALDKIHARTSAKTTDWRALLWTDESVPAAELAKIPLHHDAADFGLYTARSGWMDTERGASFFGLRCGPQAGESALRNYGGWPATAGHFYPEQGSFSFYIGARAVLPGVNYARTKLSSNHNLVVFPGRGREDGKLVGQLGEGGQWFSGAYRDRIRPARVIRRERGEGWHAYVCDLGGVYRLADERAPKGSFFPDYRRILVYLPAGSVVIADRVRSPWPREARLRLLTGADSLAVAGRDWTGRVGDLSVLIRDFSPGEFERQATKEELHLWSGRERAVATLAALAATEHLFITALGAEDHSSRLRVTGDLEQGITVHAPGLPESIVVAW